MYFFGAVASDKPIANLEKKYVLYLEDILQPKCQKK